MLLFNVPMVSDYNITILKNKKTVVISVYENQIILPGSISPFIIPITLYVYSFASRLNDFTSILLFNKKRLNIRYEEVCESYEELRSSPP
jgi:hypothetical protein